MDYSVSYYSFNESGIPVPFGDETLMAIIRDIEKKERCTFAYVEVIFVNDEEILKINQKYLNHDYYTDIITFPYHEEGNSNLEGTLYCCAPQIKRQCKEFGTSFDAEILRVVIHGLLHLVGYTDNTHHAQKQMRELEDTYITLLQDN